jgi:putative ABC transport system permease protein
VVVDAMQPVAAGLALGLVGAASMSIVLRALLFEMGTFDPATFAASVVMLAGVAGIACVVPARRASRISPLEALRES